MDNYDNEYTEGLKIARRAFAQTIDMICMNVDFTNICRAFIGERTTASEILESDNKNDDKVRNALLFFKDMFNDKNDAIIQYVFDRKIGEPFYVVVKDQNKTDKYEVNSSGDLFDLLIRLYQPKEE